MLSEKPNEEIEKEFLELFMNFFLLETTEEAVNISMENYPLWDSYNHLELVVLTEKEFGIKLSPEEIVFFSSYQKGLELISRKING